MPLAPEIASFSGGSLSGGGFGAFPGSVWLYENADRTGTEVELTVSGAWNDVQITGVEIPGSSGFLFLQREDLAWSNSLEFALGSHGGGARGGFGFDFGFGW